MGEHHTKQGYKMNRNLRFKIIQLMAYHPELPLADVAQKLGINRRTLSDYMTDEVSSVIARMRINEAQPTLESVDRAMMEQACAGNVAAARLVYMRMAQRGDIGTLPSLEELEAELERLKVLERNKGRMDDGETAGDGAAVGADAAG